MSKLCKITTRRSTNGTGYDYTIKSGSYLVAEGWCEGSRMEPVKHAYDEAMRLGYEVA